MEPTDYKNPIKISNHVYWVGTYDPTDNFQCNAYLLVVDGQGIVIDPGSVLYFRSLVKKLSQVIDLGKISNVIAHHQDPDVCGNLPLLMEAIASSGNSSCSIIAHSRTHVLIRHYGGLLNVEYADRLPEQRLYLGKDRWLEFIHTPYLHAPGAIATYFNNDKVLFSSDLFGGTTENWTLFARDTYLEDISTFHKDYMPSKEILLFAMTQIEKYDIETIAPQHGSIVEKSMIKKLVDAFRDFECGLYIDQHFRDELRAAQKRIEEQNRIMNAELAIAAQFQQSLLPDKSVIRSDPRVDMSYHYEPCRQVSGDFLIIDWIDENRLGIMIVDVVDHGVAAGLATIQIKTLFDEYKKAFSDASELLYTINDKAFSISENDIFFTALYAICDFDASVAQIASAGGIPPIFYTARDDTAQLILLKGMPLGVCDGDECLIETKCIPIDHGDVLIFQTDGLMDCSNIRSEPFDRIKSQNNFMRQVTKERSAGQVLNAILQQVDIHKGESRKCEDDVTLAVLKMR